MRLGSLHPTRDFNYVADTVEGFVLAATAPAAVGQTINLGSGREIAVGEAARLIARLIGAHVEIQCDDQRVRPQASEVERLVADNTRARALLGWQPRIGLEEGLQRTISWMREHIQRYPPAKYTL